MILKCILYILKFLTRLNSYWIGSICEVLWTDRGFNDRRSDSLPREVIIISRYVILLFSAGSGCHRFHSVYTGYVEQSRIKPEWKRQIKTSAWRRQACSVTAPAAIAGGLPPFRKGISCSTLGRLGKLNSGSRPRRQICAQKWVCVYQL